MEVFSLPAKLGEYIKCSLGISKLETLVFSVKGNASSLRLIEVKYQYIMLLCVPLYRAAVRILFFSLVISLINSGFVYGSVVFPDLNF